jgi:hypothetical protein
LIRVLLSYTDKLVATDDERDYGIETLLSLDGWTDELGGGFWISVKVFRVPPDELRPHGINYSMTMHRPGGTRIVGYDNAHRPRIGSGPARKSRQSGRGCDHRHFRGAITWYDYESSVKLMEDFWRDVQCVLKEEGVPWTE